MSPASRVTSVTALLRRHAPLLLLGLLVLWIARRSLSLVLERVGHPGATLDDSYIHFQYARAFAEGHPFRFQAGEPLSTGATSLLWPLLLAPFYLVGFHGDSILWPAWVLSYAALFGAAVETHRLVRPLAGRIAGVTAPLLVLAFGGLVWCAASGMEVVPFSYALLLLARTTVERWESRREPTRREWVVFALALNAAALLRPEGWAYATIALVLVLARETGVVKRAGEELSFDARAFSPHGLKRPFVLFAPALLTNLSLSLVVGAARSNTAQVKLLPGNPYYQGDALVAAIRANVDNFFSNILNGRVWSTEFIPDGGTGVALAALVATLLLGSREKRIVRALAIVAIALGMLIPCVYYTFLWNRLRYLWPFSPGWLMALACFAKAVGDFAGEVRRELRVAEPIVGGIFLALFATKLPGVEDDVASSASGIARQQAWLGRWADTHLPRDGVRIGLNDTGAIAYFGNRKTFDVVGLTTSTEPRYWVAGVGSRFEHYERVRREHLFELPTHFIAYPEWMGTDVFFGKVLTEAVVTDSTILGGTTMRAFEADWSLLGSGETPFAAEGRILDSVDVSDLESEADHRYGNQGVREGHNLVGHDAAPGTPRDLADGGRSNRMHDTFDLRGEDVPLGLVVRFLSKGGRIEVVSTAGAPEIRGVLIAKESSAWQEGVVELPSWSGKRHFAVQFEEPATVFHYWLVERAR